MRGVTGSTPGLDFNLQHSFFFVEKNNNPGRVVSICLEN
jgi:hypothetical protein